MFKSLSAILTFLSFSYATIAQNNVGPRLTAMGFNGAAVSDVWSLQANGAGITAIKSPSAAINYVQYLIDTELSGQAVAFVLPMKNNFLGASFQRYGIAEYNEIKGTVALAKKFGNQLSIALSANYHQLKISNYGATTAFSIDAGIMYNLSEALTFGLYVNNPSLQKYGSTNVSASIPTVITIGAAYKLSNKLLAATTLKKDFDQKLDLALGIDYKLLDLISLRGGITAKPFKQYFGTGVNYKQLVFDLAFESDPNLGYTPQIALCYAF